MKNLILDLVASVWIGANNGLALGIKLGVAWVILLAAIKNAPGILKAIGAW